MNDYFLGTDILGAESKITVTDVTPPSFSSTRAEPFPELQKPQQMPEGMYGPASSSGTYYTDKATITAVQKKLKKLGFFHGVVNGVYDGTTNAAIKNYSGKDGPPDDALLDKLGLRKEMAFADDEVDTMVVQAKQASTPAQVKVVAAEVEKLVESDAPQLKAEAAAAKRAAATASTPTEVAQAKQQVQNVIVKAQSARAMPLWKVGVIAGGVALGVGAIFGTIMLARRK